MPIGAIRPAIIFLQDKIEQENSLIVWGPLRFNKLAPKKIQAIAKTAIITLKPKKLKISVTKNHRSCIQNGSLSYSAGELRAFLQFSDSRRKEEVELTEILAGIL